MINPDILEKVTLEASKKEAVLKRKKEILKQFHPETYIGQLSEEDTQNLANAFKTVSSAYDDLKKEQRWPAKKTHLIYKVVGKELVSKKIEANDPLIFLTKVEKYLNEKTLKEEPPETKKPERKRKITQEEIEKIIGGRLKDFGQADAIFKEEAHIGDLKEKIAKIQKDLVPFRTKGLTALFETKNNADITKVLEVILKYFSNLTDKSLPEKERIELLKFRNYWVTISGKSEDGRIEIEFTKEKHSAPGFFAGLMGKKATIEIVKKIISV